MAEKLVSYGLWYLIWVLEFGVFVALLRHGRWKRLKSVLFYISSLLAIDAVGRQYVLSRYGVSSGNTPTSFG